MDENLVDDISIVGNDNINEKERYQMDFELIYYLERKKRRSIDNIIDCFTKKLSLDRSRVDDAITKLLDGTVIQSYTYNSNLCYKVKKTLRIVTLTVLLPVTKQ